MMFSTGSPRFGSVTIYFPQEDNRTPQAYVQATKQCGDLFVRDFQRNLTYKLTPTNKNASSLPKLINAFEKDYTRETSPAFVQFEPGGKEFPVLNQTDLFALLNLVPDDFRKTKK